MRKLAGKRALITGAASGIGRAVALELAQAGTHLMLVDTDEPGLTNVVAEARKWSVEVIARPCDVAQTDHLQALVELVNSRWRGVDILVNNAGVTYYGHTAQMPVEHWDYLIDVNLRAPVRLTSLLLPTLLARPEAHVLNICSILGLVGLPRVVAYSTSKFGLVGYSESLRAEYGRLGLGVTAICPGLVDTNLFRNARLPSGSKHTKRPPKWLCTTPQRVARAAVKALRRDQALVVVEPVARALYLLKRFAPGILDLAQRLGRRKRVARKQLTWVAAIEPAATAPPRRVA
ncbi:MAG: SDR family oxidoreductase [Pirellulales bacterium]